MTTQGEQATEKPTRRDQQRLATLDEIVRTARSQLVETHEISLRAVANGMGMTAPALYRYVSSLEDLTLRVAARVYDDLLETLEATAAPYAGDPAAQLVAGAAAFRQWSLAHREEFGLTFANPITSMVKTADLPADLHGEPPSTPQPSPAVLGADCAAAAHRFGSFFGGLVMEVWEREGYPEAGTVPPPDEADLGDALTEKTGQEVPDEASWAFMRSWARLYGTTALEVFGHIDAQVVANGALFRDTMTDCGELLGLQSRRDDLQKVVAEVLAG
ncbi:TetR/AcrR family transcriptional regulator [Mumia zhuanghuii]|uniref:TetR/AcrR family transcriptional regulator n=2 Tax=Mumia TaxID=1546255 RepID=A0ABW1QPS4_9ACTN|nr:MULTISPECIES: TetR/AcrR family transcriptional regulator [Mumia]KAA1420631.1 TetR/AcrR family transcriptional regulator [Mumia zhuanghuii]